ncbi:MAG TPA: MaoC family dehydratase N-terminal domain-containing protein [Mycobacteriales bacterium]|jgi:hydroxyacyl-ACP dehydratase HTD2-like protein with hotdog domain|nr:MaoC family dehydratase N-terminal domain-containing protein [Mycobacteriales bacterium]
MPTQAMDRWMARPPDVCTVYVGPQDIARFALAIGATDQAHFDAAVARSRGFADVVAPALFYVSLRTGVFNLVPPEDLHAEGTPLRDVPPIPFTQAMAGETHAELYRPFVAGDLVTCSRHPKSVSEKIGRSGKLTFVQFEYQYTGSDSRPIATENFTRIFR